MGLISFVRLCSQSERVVEVSLSPRDAEEYAKMEAVARQAYTEFKATTHKIGTGFLKVSHMLLPLRIACAGGKIPLSDEDDSNDGLEDKERKRKVVRLSEFAFTSKMRMLMEELKRARDEDAASKSLVF